MNWWELFSVTTEQLLEVVRVLHDLYQRPPAHYVPPSTDSGAQAAKAGTPDLVGAHGLFVSPKCGLGVHASCHGCWWMRFTCRA
jgi:hypothetical protein